MKSEIKPHFTNDLSQLMQWFNKELRNQLADDIDGYTGQPSPYDSFNVRHACIRDIHQLTVKYPDSGILE